MLLRLVADLLATTDPPTDPAADLRIVRACRACGSDRHGKPHVVGPPGRSRVHLSLGRSAGRAVVAVTGLGPVGVDLEALGPETDDDLVAWVRTESLVKATGHGLTIDPGSVEGPRRTIDLPAPDGFIAALTVLTDVAPAVVTTQATPAG